MDRKFLARMMASMVILSLCVVNLMAVNEKPFVIPELKQWTGGEGVFVPTSATKIVVDATAKEYYKVAEALKEDYKVMFGDELQVVEGGKPSNGDIVFKLGGKKDVDERFYARCWKTLFPYGLFAQSGEDDGLL